MPVWTYALGLAAFAPFAAKLWQTRSNITPVRRADICRSSTEDQNGAS